jgi:hypothetical protein
MNARVVDVTGPSAVRSRRQFWRHFAEMIVVMLLSMAVLGAAVSAVFAFAGHANLLHYVALRGLLMTAYMVVGMASWMRYRGHVWARVAEMSTAMALPYVMLIGPYLGGVIEDSAFLAAMHVLMLPSMYAAMALRRGEFEQDHRGHGQPDREPEHRQEGSSWAR